VSVVDGVRGRSAVARARRGRKRARVGARASRITVRVGRAASLPTLIALGLSGCGLLFPSPPAASEAGTAPPPPVVPELPVGLGTLRQNEVSMYLRRGELQVRVTPLDESVIGVTAPDTYERLSALARGHQEIFRERTGSAVPFQLFLVSLYTESVEVTFEPEALTIVNRGLRYRPVAIRAVTPGWETRRISPRQALLAIYAFTNDLDLEREVEVEYQEVRSRDWGEILIEIQRARARMRARTAFPD
jgi:hypothetical protein